MLKLHHRYTYQDIFQAYIDCRRAKRNKNSTIAFETRFEKNLDRLLDDVNSGEYQIGRSEVFVVERPKAREIWAAKFRDRIVHHLVYNDIGEHFEERFIEDTFSCIKGRGTLTASNRLSTFHRRITNNYADDCWFLQFDIKNFFVSINKDILWKALEPKIGDELGDHTLTTRLVKQIIENDPTVSPIIKPNSRFELVPKHKSLWHCPKHKGLPIGNLTSQFFSNVYMDAMDKFIKHVLKAKYYVRYVDDAVILSKDRAYLEWCLDEIDRFIRERLDLVLHPDKCMIKKASQGINFVGYIVKPYRRYTRRMTVESAKVLAGSQPTEANISSINSYLGIMKHSDSYNLRKAICVAVAVPTLVGHDSGFNKLVLL